MELKDFIEQTITQIAQGIKAGDDFIQKNSLGYGVDDEKGKEIQFDIAVTTNEEEKTGLGGKVSVAHIFSAGASNESASKSSNVSRIQFKIFVHLKLKQ